MTRIIAGAAGGTVIAIPSAGTRPTSDRVRESLFGALDAADLLHGARVADLYAGSGALGLEAASRGAAAVDFVEKAPEAASVLRRNAARVAQSGRLSAPLRVHRAAVTTFLTAAARGPYDLVFLDPPYDLPDADLAAALTALAGRLSEDAVVIVERARRSPEPPWADAGLEALRTRAYGDTVMWWGQPRPASQSR
ncbi:MULTISPECIES: 16S rRNA (guanine(966)-N(2))-methyltransferase RsmD [Microbacterium]|uniref:16S rRNA (Guanine(966)-N(2))-methyltransferase RsmD n=1 Tax=Microbacterium wangchenii TaxID=2541726 RepID=A0ABX5SSE3_9MICO|nr:MULTISPECIES: 16S rRNA (guanine(966)-N(2))-methyltransferase RsmD [Microbacterium]MCK6065639.1 16S rRNA (guanine(966)-N(2))-methyltransferase RsmD [Microbacterium sp. EYE_512]QBR89056.1 16S rRNA (guanine(966)-N(2))-methyltransferase RsmD [Microbacterium wangchenii]TXK20776.1 16S rRNA (guanine(966)-N(2))-methyltransferase RsmD [Microbacterium wangchenii]